MTQDLPAAALARRALLLAAPLVMLGTAPAALAQVEAVPVRFAYNPSAPIGTYIAAIGTDAFAHEGIRLDTQRFSEPAAALDAIKRAHAELGLRWDDAKTLD